MVNFMNNSGGFESGNIGIIPGLPVNNPTQIKVNELSAQPSVKDTSIMSQDEFFSIVDNAVNSGDFQGQTTEQIYNGMLESVTQDGIKVEGLKAPSQIPQQPEDISGFDLGVKFGRGARDIAQGFKFESNVDDKIVESSLKFLANLPANVVQLSGDIISLASDPVGTTKSVGELAGTAVEQSLNKAFSTEFGQGVLRQAGLDESKIQQIGGEGFFTSDEREFLRDVMGQELGRIANEPGRVKELLVENPADVLLTITGGLGIAKNTAKAKGLTGLANKLETAEKLTNPINVLAKEAQLVTKPLGGGKVSEKLIDSTLKFTPTQTTKTTKAAGKSPSEWLLEKNILDDVSIKAGKEGVVTKLQEFNTNAFNKLNTEVATAKGVFKNEAVNEGLKALRKEYSDVPGMKDKFNRVKELSLKAERGEGLNLSEILFVKREMDNALDLFKITGDLKAGAAKEGLANIRSTLRKFIEAEAKNQKLSDVKQLSNDIRVSRLMKDNLVNRIEAGASNNIIGLTDIIVGGAAGVGTGDFGTTLAILAGKKIIESPAFKISAVKTLQVPSKIIEKINQGVKLTNKEAVIVGNAVKEYVIERGAKIVDDIADQVGARSKFIDDTQGFKEVGTTGSAKLDDLSLDILTDEGLKFFERRMDRDMVIFPKDIIKHSKRNITREEALAIRDLLQSQKGQIRKAKQKLLEQEFNHPSDLSQEAYDLAISKNVITSDASDAVRLGRIIGTKNEPRYTGETVTMYRALDSRFGDDIRPGDWVSLDKDYVVEHGNRYLKPGYKILEETVDGKNVLKGPTGNIEEAIYAPLDLSEDFSFYK